MDRNDAAARRIEVSDQLRAIRAAAFEAQTVRAGAPRTLWDAAEFKAGVRAAMVTAIQQHPLRDEIIGQLAAEALVWPVEEEFKTRAIFDEGEATKIEHTLQSLENDMEAFGGNVSAIKEELEDMKDDIFRNQNDIILLEQKISRFMASIETQLRRAS